MIPRGPWGEPMLHLLATNPKRGWRSRLASLRRNFLLLLLPLLFAAVMTWAWVQFYPPGWHLPDGAKEMVGTAVVVQAAIFAVAAAMLLDGTWKRVQKLSRHVLAGDQRAFMLLRDEKMPIPMHLVLLGSGLSLIVLLSAAPYPDACSGALILFLTWFALSLYFMVVSALQNITASVWFTNRVPKLWLEEEVDKAFGTGFSEYENSEGQPQQAEGNSAAAPPKSG
jgi:hypothetical protein